MAEEVAAAPVQLGENESVSKMLGTVSKATDSSFRMETYIANLTTTQIYFGEHKLWPGTAGSLWTQGPIPSGYYILGTHTGTLPAGAKFGLVYYDAQELLPTTRKFIIAFDSPAGKVYAEPGVAGPVDWNVVEDRLSKSGRTTVVVDDILGGKIQAEVHENGNAYVEFLYA